MKDAWHSGAGGSLRGGGSSPAGAGEGSARNHRHSPKKVVQNQPIFPSIRCDNFYLKEVIAAPQFPVLESG